MTVTVFGIPGSPYLRSALLALEEKGVAYDLSRLGFGVTRTPQWRERHPFGRIPAFEHDGFRLYETAPFIRYVDAAFDGPALAPADVRQAARMDQLMGVVDWYVMPQITATIGFQRFIAPLLGQTTDEAACAAAVPDAENCLRAIAELAAPGAPFLVGEQLTLADLMLAPHLDFLAMAPEGERLLAGGPLKAWLDGMRARPSMRKTSPQVLMAAAA